MSNARKVFEAIARDNGGTDFSLKQDGRYAVQNIQSRWVYFKFGWDKRPAREWVGLTDEEANELWESTDSDWELMKRTEAKLREKNA